MSFIARLIESHWQQPRWYLSLLLFPLSLLFGTVAALRRTCYRTGCLKVQKLDVPVIVIGNLHVGGTGKTPVTAALAQALDKRGIKVGIISRGYGRKNAAQAAIVDASGSAEHFGDEPLLLAQKTGIPVAVCSDRVAAGRLLLNTFPDIRLILSDDGLQHYALYRDCEIVVLPAGDTRRLHMLPEGVLREPLSRLNAVNAVIVSNSNGTLPFRLPEDLSVYHSQLNTQHFYALSQPSRTVDTDFFANKKTVALAAIARPQRFFDTLSAAGLTLHQIFALPDHASLTVRDIPSAETVVITEKDAVKLTDCAAQLPQVWVLPVCAIIPPDLTEQLYQDYGC